MIQLVIEIPDTLYKYYKDKNVSYLTRSDSKVFFNAAKNGTPLPKGHGRLIDEDDIRVIELEDSLHFMQHKKGDDVDVYIDAPTIIEADKNERDKSEVV